MSKHEKKNGGKGFFRRPEQTPKPAEKEVPAVQDAAEELSAAAVTAEIPAAESQDPSAEELRALFERYLGAEAAEEAAEATPAAVSVDEMPADVVEESFEIEKSDVEKNIDEAEKYVNEMEAQAEQESQTEIAFAEDPMSDATGGFALNVETEQLGAFAPEQETQQTDLSLHETRVLDFQKTEEATITDLPTDTAMMKAFGLDPKTSEVKRDKFFEEMQTMAVPEAAPVTEEVHAARDEEMADWEALAESKSEKGGFEYVDPSQNKDIFAAFKKKYNAAKIRMVLAGVVAVLLGLLENLPNMKDYFGDNQLIIATDWLLTLVAAAIVFDRLIVAAKSLLKFEFDSDSITLVSFFLSLVATTATLIIAPTFEEVFLFNFPFGICVFLNAMKIFLSLRQDVYSFKVISASGEKKILSRTAVRYEDVPEQAAFAANIGPSDTICTIKRTDFISSFFAHRGEKSTSKFLLKIFIPECFVFSIIYFVISFFIMENSLVTSFGTAYAAFLMCIPFTAFLTYVYPVYLASRRAYSYHSAILSDKTHDNYDKTAVIAFRDEDAFPAGRTKVKSLKLYGERKIEDVMYYASSVYSVLGGPLAPVFKQATLNSEISKDVEIRELAPDGASVMVDGKNVVVGTPAYMDAQCFATVFDEGDEEYEGKSHRRILYLACDQKVIAKFYVQYTTTSDFLYMVHNLARAGVSVSIRTADPCLDDGILYNNKMNPEELPVKVIKGVLAEDKFAEVSARTGGIVSMGTAKEIVKTFLVCDKIDNVKKINFILKTVASVLGLAVMMLVLFTGHAAEMTSIFPAIYQLFWLIPIYLISKIYI